MPTKIVSIVLLLLAGPAFAAADESGRYQILSVSGGFVRLDTATGATTFCRDEVDSFRCTPVAIETGNALTRPEPGKTDDRTDRAQRPVPDNTDDEDFDRALNFMQRAMRSMLEMTREKTPECAL